MRVFGSARDRMGWDSSHMGAEFLDWTPEFWV